MATEKKPWYERWWAIVLYVFVGLIIIGNLLPETEVTKSPKEDVTTETASPTGEVSETSAEPEVVKVLEETKETIVNYQDKTEKLNECTRLCAGEDYDIPVYKDEWYSACYEIYYYGGMEALDKQIAECRE